METDRDPESGRTDAAEELRLRLTAAPPEYLSAAYENPALGEKEMVLLLRNREAPSAILQRAARDRRWQKSYEVKVALVRHPRTPYVVARSLIGHLFWRDLMETSVDVRVGPVLRREAEKLLSIRLPELTLGERVSLARRAGPGVIPALRDSGEAPVLEALLGNPRTTEREVLLASVATGTPAEALAAIARHPTWGVRRAVRMAVLGNTRTPVPAALHLVEVLPPHDLEKLAHDPLAPRIVRTAAHRRLERPGGPRRGGFG